MIPFGIVSAQKLARPYPVPNSITLDFKNDVYTVDAVSADPFDLLNGLSESFLTADGLGNRSSTDVVTAKGPLLQLMTWGVKNNLQVLIDWKVVPGGTTRVRLLRWANTGASGTFGLHLESSATSGFTFFKTDGSYEVTPSGNVGYNGSYYDTDTVQHGGLFLGMLEAGYPSRRYYGVALNNSGTASSYIDGGLVTDTISSVSIGGYSSLVNPYLVISRLVVEKLEYDYANISDFNALTANP